MNRFGQIWTVWAAYTVFYYPSGPEYSWPGIGGKSAQWIICKHPRLDETHFFHYWWADFLCSSRKTVCFFFPHCSFLTCSASFPAPWAWSVTWRPTSPSSPTPQSSTSWRCGAAWATPSSSSSSGFPPSGRTTSGTGPTFASRLFSASFGGHLVRGIVDFGFSCCLWEWGMRFH